MEKEEEKWILIAISGIYLTGSRFEDSKHVTTSFYY